MWPAAELVENWTECRGAWQPRAMLRDAHDPFTCAHCREPAILTVDIGLCPRCCQRLEWEAIRATAETALARRLTAARADGPLVYVSSCSRPLGLVPECREQAGSVGITLVTRPLTDLARPRLRWLGPGQWRAVAIARAFGAMAVRYARVGVAAVLRRQPLAGALITGIAPDPQ
jgi:hypothetical protein